MDSENILGQLRPLSKRNFTLSYSCFSFSGICLYERLYNLIRGKTGKPRLVKVIFQYLAQTFLGIYRTDYGVLKTDCFVQGSDTLVGLIASIKLLQEGNSVVFYGYNLEDYSIPTKMYSEKRYNSIPDESMKLICGEIGIEFEFNLSIDDLCRKILLIIERDHKERFIFLRNSKLSNFYEIEKGQVASLVLNQDMDDGFFLGANELIFLDSFRPENRFQKNRKRGRVISMIKSKIVVQVSQMTKDTPRTDLSYEVSIGDGDRQTQAAGDLYIKDRNKDIVEALAVNEKIRYSHGISR